MDGEENRPYLEAVQMSSLLGPLHAHPVNSYTYQLDILALQLRMSDAV